MRDYPLNAEAQAILRHAVVAELRCGADELSTLVREVQRELPVLPLDPAAREAALMALLLQARDQSKRLLTLLGGDGQQC